MGSHSGSQKKRDAVVEEGEHREQAVMATGSASEQLAALEEQRRALREQLKQEKKSAVEKRKNERVAQRGLIDVKDSTLSRIQQSIYAYNRLNRCGRAKSDVLDQILRIIDEFNQHDK